MKKFRSLIVLCFSIVALFLSSSVVMGEDIDIVEKLQAALKSKDYEQAESMLNLVSSGLKTEKSNYTNEKARLVTVLVEALNYEWDRCSGDLRQSIAHALIDLRAKEAVIPMIDILRSGKSTGHECAECGCCLLLKTPGEMLANTEYDPFCEDTVLQAVRKLSDYSHSKAISEAIDADVHRVSLIIILGGIGPKRYANFIGKYRNNLDERVRAAVAMALGTIDNDEVSVPVLIQLLSRSDEARWVKEAAAESLLTAFKRGKTPSLPSRLKEILKEKNKISVLLASRVLALGGDESGFKKLRDLAHDQDPYVRADALLYLGEAEDVQSKGLFVAKMHDENLNVRACAIFALGRVGDHATSELLGKVTEEMIEYETGVFKMIREAGSAKGNETRIKYGNDIYDMRETLLEAIKSIRSRSKPEGSNK